MGLEYHLSVYRQCEGTFLGDSASHLVKCQEGRVALIAGFPYVLLVRALGAILLLGIGAWFSFNYMKWPNPFPEALITAFLVSAMLLGFAQIFIIPIAAYRAKRAGQFSTGKVQLALSCGFCYFLLFVYAVPTHVH